MTPKKIKLKKISDSLVKNLQPERYEKAEQSHKWLTTLVKNTVYRENIEYESQEFIDRISHALDYLNSSDAPKRFDRMTLDEMDRQVKGWERILNNRGLSAQNELDMAGVMLGNLSPIQIDETIDGVDVYSSDLGEGWYAVELSSRGALNHEGFRMQNCVGSYYNNVKSGSTRIFSLRGENGSPHVTIEYNADRGEIVQVRGKQNQKPSDKYINKVVSFIKSSGMEPSGNVAAYLGLKYIGKNMIFANDDEYAYLVKGYLKGNPNHQGGGYIEINGIDIDQLSGRWDRVVIKNGSTVNRITNSKIKKLDISENSKIGELSGSFRDVVLDNVSINSVDQMSANSVKSYMTKFDPNSATIKNLLIEHSKNEININQQIPFDRLEIRWSRIGELNTLGKELTVMGDIEGSKKFKASNIKFSEVAVDVIYDDVLSDLKLEKLKVKEAPNLREIANNRETKEISILRADKLTKIEDNKVGMISIGNSMALESIKRNRAHFFSANSGSDDLTVKRNIFKVIKTKNPKLFRTKTMKRGIPPKR